MVETVCCMLLAVVIDIVTIVVVDVVMLLPVVPVAPVPLVPLFVPPVPLLEPHATRATTDIAIAPNAQVFM